MRTFALLTLLAALVPLTGCTHPHFFAPEDTLDPHFGEAQSRNIAVQVVNPDAAAANPDIAMDGQRAALAQSRYVKGKVIKPSDVSTGLVGSTDASSGGGDGDAK